MENPTNGKRKYVKPNNRVERRELMDAAVMIPVLLALTSFGLWFHAIVSLIHLIVDITIYKTRSIKEKGE